MTAALPSSFTALLCEQLRIEDGIRRARDGRGLGTLVLPLYPERFEEYQETLGALLDACFFGSLQTEEGQGARFALRIGERDESMLFEAPTAITPHTLAKLSAMSAGTPHPETTLLVRRQMGKWVAYGLASATLTTPTHRNEVTDRYHLDIVSSATGALRVYGNGRPIFSYDRGMGYSPGSKPDAFIAEILGQPGADEAAPQGPSIAYPVLPTAATAMASLRRGGALLVLPSPEAAPFITFGYKRLPLIGQPDNLARSILAYKAYYRELAAGNPECQAEGFLGYLWEKVLDEARLLGRMTGVDGFVAVTHDCTILGFAGKLSRTDSDVPITITDSQTGDIKEAVAGRAFPGMRHTSAAVACVNGGRGSLALVLSQDGFFTLVGHGGQGVRALTRLAHL